MSARLTIALLTTGLLAAAPAAYAATKNGVTPLAPKAGKSVPAGKSPTFKLRAKGPGTVWVHVCKSKRKDSDGLICRDATFGQAKKRAGIFRYKPRYFDLPDSWLNNPGTYYWQAHRIACNATITDCSQEGPIVKFKVAG